ncbi:MAG TPA: glycogen-binding domain-containing protein [Treponemataceae bacterium]|nr:glycogen-binding domain-containing protein [Treponemataceae bacterium]
MKRILTLIIAMAVVTLSAHAAGIEAATYDKLVSTVSRAREPVVSGHYVVFTAKGDARFTGIAFEHERYGTIHPFKRIVRKGPDGKPEVDASGRNVEPVLFFIGEIPPEMDRLRYRIVIDGLWTTDPQNDLSDYDYDNGMMVSVLPVERYEVFETSNVSKNAVRFTYEGTPGESITVAGTFNNWDPFMYDLTEVSPGKYELTLPLPAGTWYYAYFQGTSQLPDQKNHNRVYTKDGRVASVVNVE